MREVKSIDNLIKGLEICKDLLYDNAEDGPNQIIEIQHTCPILVIQQIDLDKVTFDVYKQLLNLGFYIGEPIDYSRFEDAGYTYANVTESAFEEIKMNINNRFHTFIEM